MESPSIGKLSSMYMYTWQKGLKTTYYLRSRPATKIAQVAAGDAAAAVQPEPDVQAYSDVEAVVCSLENPEACEACQ
jgi:ribonucleoside-diphosphate reductase alpha chain